MTGCHDVIHEEDVDHDKDPIFEPRSLRNTVMLENEDLQLVLTAYTHRLTQLLCQPALPMVCCAAALIQPSLAFD